MDNVPGTDNITAEEIVAADEAGVSIYFKLFKEIWYQEQVSEDWRRAVIVPILKKRDITAEKYLEHGTDLYPCYIDFRRAFDSACREGLLKVMRFYGLCITQRVCQTVMANLGSLLDQ